MGQRGPRPAPTSLKLVRGARKDRVNSAEPEAPTDARPSCPAYLSKEAKAEWGRLAASLWERGRLLTEWDRASFATYCEAVATHEAATREIQRHGLVVETQRERYSRSGDLLTTDTIRMLNPAERAQRAAAAIIRAFAREFGLTPSARSELKVSKADGPSARRLLS